MSSDWRNGGRGGRDEGRGGFRRDNTGRPPFRRNDEGRGRGDDEGQAWRPFESPRPREGTAERGDARPPFRDRPFARQDERPSGPRHPSDFQDEEAQQYRPGRGGRFDREDRGLGDRGDEPGRPPFRDRGDRPGGGRFNGGEDRPFNRGGDRPYGGQDRPFAGREDRPFNRDDRPPFRDRGDRPGGGRFSGGEDRPFNRGNRPYGGRPEGGQDRPFNRGGDRPFAGREDRPFNRDDRPPFRDRNDRPPYGGRRDERGGFGGRPSFGDQRGARPFERRDDRPSFEEGRPLGTATRAGRNPVSQFEDVQADVYGRWPVLEALRAGKVVRIFLAAGVNDSASHLQEIQALASERSVPIVRVERQALDRAVGGANHQGVAAARRPFEYTPFEDLVQQAGQADLPLLLVCDGVQDPQNLGSMLRTAEGAGVQGAVLPKHQQVGVTSAVVRASAGAVEHLPVAEITNLRQSMERLKEAGYWLVGLDMEGGTDYDNFEVNSPIALIVGGEGQGLGRLVGEQCDYLVRLPMRGKVSSLNASVATGIVLYDIQRRRDEEARRAGKPRRPAVTAAVRTEATEDDTDAADTEVAEEETEDLVALDQTAEETLADDESLAYELLEDDLNEGDATDLEEAEAEQSAVETEAGEAEVEAEHGESGEPNEPHTAAQAGESQAGSAQAPTASHHVLEQPATTVQVIVPSGPQTIAPAEHDELIEELGPFEE